MSEAVREPLPAYRALWSADRRLCALWLDRGDRAERLGYVEKVGDGVWEAYCGDVLPIRSMGCAPSARGVLDHAWQVLLHVHGAPDVPITRGTA